MKEEVVYPEVQPEAPGVSGPELQLRYEHLESQKAMI